MLPRLALSILVSLAACAQRPPPRAPGPVCAPEAGRDAQVVKAVVDMYAAFRADDLAAFRAVTTPDFYAFEVGKRFDGDALTKLLVEAHAQGRRFEWSVTEPVVRVDCTLAVITYVNVGAIGDASGMQPRSWLESAALVYDAGAWRIRFFHSTPVPSTPAPGSPSM